MATAQKSDLEWILMAKLHAGNGGQHRYSKSYFTLELCAS